MKWVPTRRESFLSDIHAREQTIEVEVGADAAGVVTGMRARITAAVGPCSAFPRSSVVEGGQVLRLLPGPYRIRDYEGTLRVVAQNKVITSQYRAVGHPIAAAVTESLLDQIARDLALDPAEIRRRNLVRPDELPWTSATGSVYDSGSYQAALARLLEVARYDDPAREQARARAAGRHLGIGLACFLELTGPGAQFYGVGGARSPARTAPRCGWSPRAPSPRWSASPTRARARRPRWRRSSPTSWRCRSTPSRCSRGTPR